MRWHHLGRYLSISAIGGEKEHDNEILSITFSSFFVFVVVSMSSSMSSKSSCFYYKDVIFNNVSHIIPILNPEIKDSYNTKRLSHTL